MHTDPDEASLADAERRADPKRTGDILERVEWRLQYGECAAPPGLKVIGWLIVILLALILWRVW